MIKQLLTLFAGLIFGLGLAVSGMVEPSKILGFLDVAGDWNPSLAVVMATALLTYGLILRLPINQNISNNSNSQDCLPTNAGITLKLIGGSVIFGIGWGLVGICPGPAFVNLTSGAETILVFLITMFVGFCMFQYINY